MTEGEIENIVPKVLNTGSETGALVEVKFQKNPYQTQKYLEAEPKALGVTQIMLGLFVFSTKFSSPITHFNSSVVLDSFFSLVSIIAGSVTIAAKNLHLPTLKACLGMQVVACVLSVFSFLDSLGNIGSYSIISICWDENLNDTSPLNMCERLLSIAQHITGIDMLVQVTQVALSATLAAFSCKVIQCCSPKKNVPVIVVNAPPGSQ